MKRPRGAPRVGERYRKWTGEEVTVRAVFRDREAAAWYVVVSFWGKEGWLWPEVVTLDVWCQPVRGDDGQPVPRFAREP